MFCACIVRHGESGTIRSCICIRNVTFRTLAEFFAIPLPLEEINFSPFHNNLL